jgi:hypothetical protein
LAVLRLAGFRSPKNCYGSAVRMPAGLTFIAIGADFVSVLPSNANAAI